MGSPRRHQWKDSTIAIRGVRLDAYDSTDLSPRHCRQPERAPPDGLQSLLRSWRSS